MQDLDSLTARALADIEASADLAALALFMWAAATTGLLVWTLRELAAANRRFDAFVRGWIDEAAGALGL